METNLKLLRFKEIVIWDFYTIYFKDIEWTNKETILNILVDQILIVFPKVDKTLLLISGENYIKYFEPPNKREKIACELLNGYSFSQIRKYTQVSPNWLAKNNKVENLQNILTNGKIKSKFFVNYLYDIIKDITFKNSKIRRKKNNVYM